MDDVDKNIIFSLFKIFYDIKQIDELINLIKNWDLSFINEHLKKLK